MPEISVDWWNVERGEKQTAKVAPRLMHVRPGIYEAAPKADIPMQMAEPAAAPPQSPLLYLLTGLLVGLLLMALLWGISLQRRIARLTELPPKETKPVEKPIISPKKSKREKLPDLNPT